uniref:Uncharacterized protein n=1 Tax=Glossina austeni TaxID=7395 RepID=A0A1A9VDF0_GLOAU
MISSALVASIIPISPSTSSKPTRKIAFFGNSNGDLLPLPVLSNWHDLLPVLDSLSRTNFGVIRFLNCVTHFGFGFSSASPSFFLGAFFGRSYFGLISFFGGSGIFSMKPSFPTALIIPTRPSRSSMLTRKIDSVGNSKGLYLPLPGNSMPSDIGIFFTPEIQKHNEDIRGFASRLSPTSKM